MLYFRILSQDMNCVAAIGVVHFSVRGFGCALFYFRKEYENMKAKKFLAVATAIALLISLTACAGTGNEQASSADKSTSDITDSAPSLVDESSDTATQSKEETTVSTESTTVATTSAASIEESSDTVTQSKEETTAGTESTTAATTPAASVEESSDTVTESEVETTVSTAGTSAESLATEAPATTKAETIAPTLSKNERYVYDEDGNVVDKIKVKVVDGVTYTVGEKSDDKAILKNAPLISNGDKYPSGTSISCVTMLLQFNGEKVTQDDVAKMFTYYSESDWYYGEDGRYYGPEKSPFILLSDPKKKSEIFYSDVCSVEVGWATRKYCDEHDYLEYSIFEYFDITDNFEAVQRAVEDNSLLSISVRNGKIDVVTKKWIANCENGTERLIEVDTQYFSCMLIGYKGENIYVYDPYNDITLAYEYNPVNLINDVDVIVRE